MSAGASVRAGQRTVAISHPERVVFGVAGVTKLDLARYFADVAAVAVPHLRDRPLALQSFPRGVEETGFFLKNAPRHFPDWIATARVPKHGGGANAQVLGNAAATLAYLAGQNTVALHVGTSRADRLEQPDRLILDLDPDGQPFAEIRAAARQAGALLRELGLAPFAMVTGSRGLHVVVALRRRERYPEVHAFASALAARLAAEHPRALTTSFRKADRGGRLYLDVARNGYGQHAIAPYSPRALPGAPVATPLHWDELDDRRLDPQGWTIATVRDRLADGGDPWAGLARSARGLGPARRALG